MCRVGGQMPLGERSEADLQLEPNPTPNQAMPLLVSSRGRYLWLDGVEEVKFSGGYIHCQGTAELYPKWGAEHAGRRRKNRR